MYVFRHYTDCPSSLRGGVLAIGNFDGVHLGHRAVLEEAQGIATRHQVPLLIMTFQPHPRRFFRPETAALAIDPLHVRLRRLKALGVNGILLQRFNTSFAALTAAAFVETVLSEALGVSHVVVGEDFHFGKGREGNVHRLQEMAIAERMGCTYVPPVIVRDVPVSSSRIRACLSEGRIEDAATLLGRPYQIYGRVIHGEKRGREMHTPTANIGVEGLHFPRFGVYAVQYALLESADCSQDPPQWCDGIANLGVRPSFGEGSPPLLEVHGFQSMGQVYGRFMRVRLLRHIRDECTFSDAQALQRQIRRDIASVKAYHGSCSLSNTPV